jgi:uncharacterized membrane protein (UPF0127 family)|tara:strand:+ start:773 stop:1114 length:342 start_codon:yes stop_codon:yes gene_type:complete
MIIKRGNKKLAEGKFLGKFSLGLIFKRELKHEAYILESLDESVWSSTLHTFFVFQNLDIVWLNKNGKIVDMIEVAPRFHPALVPKEKAKYIIEAPKGFIKKHRLKNGQKLKIS